MKIGVWYIAVVATVCVGLAGCGGSHNIDARLAQVNDLANAGEADSAIALLQSIEKTSLNEYNSRYHDLMDIKTRDKADADITGDTAIVDIMEYFDDEGPDEVRGEAYYYGGRVYREIGDAPQALDYYQKAQDAYPQDQAFMKGKIASQMGQIFLELYMFDHAKTKFQEAIHHQKACKDTSALILNIRALGDTYSSLHHKDSALYYFNDALKLVQKKEPCGQRELRIRASIINIYLSFKDYKHANNEYDQIKSHLNEVNNEYVLMTFFRMEIINGEYENAKKLASRLLGSSNLHVKKYVYETTADLIRHEGYLHKSYNYIKESVRYQDSINSQASQNAVVNQNSLYNYSIREKENISLKNNLLLQKCILLMCVIFIIAISLLTLWLYERNRSLKRQLALQLSKISNLESKNCKIAITSDETKSVSELKKNIKECIQSFTGNVDFNTYKVSEKIISSKIYGKLRQCLERNDLDITDRDWIELDEAINLAYPGFKNKLYQLHSNISAHEYHICLLLKCKMGSTDIGKLTFRDKTSIASTRKRLYKKFFCEEGSAKEFDVFIYSL